MQGNVNIFKRQKNATGQNLNIAVILSVVFFFLNEFVSYLLK